MRTALLSVLAIFVLSCAKPHYSYYFDKVIQPPPGKDAVIDRKEGATLVDLSQEPLFPQLRDTLLSVAVPTKPVHVGSIANTEAYSAERKSIDHSLIASTRALVYRSPLTLTQKKTIEGTKVYKITTKKVIGFLIIVLGAILLTGGILDIVIGTVLMVIGGLMMSPKDENDMPRQRNKAPAGGTDYLDVVYLKNGSVVKGTITEQVPNETVKIKTSDGNTFEYKITEVEKITKEKQP